MRTFTRPLRLLQALGSLRAGIPALGAALLCA
ncbi:flagellar basal body L-ring protein FlgH, partial [Acidovorax sp. SD340]|nr:flagellar basal body L-ring protein FlgH [Acidovorax sp. SD340]